MVRIKTTGQEGRGRLHAISSKEQACLPKRSPLPRPLRAAPGWGAALRPLIGPLDDEAPPPAPESGLESQGSQTQEPAGRSERPACMVFRARGDVQCELAGGEARAKSRLD